MKNLLLASALVIGATAFAEGTAAPAAAAAAKLTHKQAKEQCLKDNKDLKGPKLQECIKGKTK